LTVCLFSGLKHEEVDPSKFPSNASWSFKKAFVHDHNNNDKTATHAMVDQGQKTQTISIGRPQEGPDDDIF
jgi:hypothetical protein